MPTNYKKCQMTKKSRKCTKKSRKPTKKSRKCTYGIRKSDRKCKRKPGPKRSRKMKKSRKTISQKKLNCKSRKLVYNTKTKRCRKSKRNIKNPKRSHKIRKNTRKKRNFFRLTEDEKCDEILEDLGVSDSVYMQALLPEKALLTDDGHWLSLGETEDSNTLSKYIRKLNNKNPLTKEDIDESNFVGGVSDLLQNIKNAITEELRKSNNKESAKKAGIQSLNELRISSPSNKSEKYINQELDKAIQDLSKDNFHNGWKHVANILKTKNGTLSNTLTPEELARIEQREEQERVQEAQQQRQELLRQHYAILTEMQQKMIGVHFLKDNENNLYIVQGTYPETEPEKMVCNVLSPVGDIKRNISVQWNAATQEYQVIDILDINGNPMIIKVEPTNYDTDDILSRFAQKKIRYGDNYTLQNLRDDVDTLFPRVEHKIEIYNKVIDWSNPVNVQNVQNADQDYYPPDQEMNSL